MDTKYGCLEMISWLCGLSAHFPFLGVAEFATGFSEGQRTHADSANRTLKTLHANPDSTWFIPRQDATRMDEGTYCVLTDD